MKLDPRPSLAATVDRTIGQAARLRNRLLPLHLTRPSAPSALATRPAVISSCTWDDDDEQALHLVGDSYNRCARAERHELAVRQGDGVRTASARIGRHHQLPCGRSL
jgi:hypothetical protein